MGYSSSRPSSMGFLSSRLPKSRYSPHSDATPGLSSSCSSSLPNSPSPPEMYDSPAGLKSPQKSSPSTTSSSSKSSCSSFPSRKAPELLPVKSEPSHGLSAKNAVGHGPTQTRPRQWTLRLP